MNYKLKLEIFEGPLDLLLYLIKKDDIDIKDIPIVQVTAQYMEYIEMMKMLDLDIVGDFLVMAATLMHIKSKMLLPPDPVEVEQTEEDPRDELARRLLEYKKFKEIAGILGGKEIERRDFFNRMIDEESKRQLQEESKEISFEASLFDLINAFSDALKKLPEDVIHEILKEEFTVEKKIHDLMHRLIAQPRLILQEIFLKCRSKTEMIVSFLAILELIRLKEIKVIQQEVFGDIEVTRNKDKAQQSQEDSEVQITQEKQEVLQANDAQDLQETQEIAIGQVQEPENLSNQSATDAIIQDQVYNG